ncbi:uncharacterized protein FOMMEDRAFT_157536 [Fomitiporia mediterranea MF3/22]|uniref:uncharacterized protein n=1 Tax=Fomitiporia mediterranea (strain MF3/22) TaxID=694068 RepID=UPI00044075BC|nr:uncharacterized protein FOMMEDRAFT_157536 [Fomitiporia mediterranea MF3/22]EJD02316.1 hypothetical protein FOMMEDRAFT_157536 [Fomitiporia mediterranea MF3/22]
MATQEAVLDNWIKDIRGAVNVYDDEISRTKVRDLYYTLPTRKPEDVPPRNAPISPLHYLAFFHPRLEEKQLASDLTETDFRPPLPFGARRMWVGGSLRFPKGSDQGICVGDEANAKVSVEKVEKKGFEKGSQTVFMHKDIHYMRQTGEEPIIKEKRVHAYLPEEARPSGKIREVPGLPIPRFTYTWTPTVTTLFRFSALMWNAHLIHLDREYTRTKEGYPDLLVHGPLTAIMLVEALLHNGYQGRINDFEYRARNPVYVDRIQHIRGAIDADESKATLWAEDDDGVVGMTGSVELQRD